VLGADATQHGKQEAGAANVSNNGKKELAMQCMKQVPYLDEQIVFCMFPFASRRTLDAFHCTGFS
jgi:hypothetical protein